MVLLWNRKDFVDIQFFVQLSCRMAQMQQIYAGPGFNLPTSVPISFVNVNGGTTGALASHVNGYVSNNSNGPEVANTSYDFSSLTAGAFTKP